MLSARRKLFSAAALFTLLLPASAPALETHDQLMRRLVNTKRKVMFAIRQKDGETWGDKLGTAFCVSLNGGQCILATAAHVIEDTNGGIVGPANLGAFRRGVGSAIEVHDCWLHPERRFREGPDVALIRIDSSVIDDMTPFVLLPKRDARPLTTQEFGFLGFVGKFGADSWYDRSFVSKQEEQKGVDHVVYRLQAAGPGSSGAPLFLLDDSTLDGSSRSEAVFAIHSAQINNNLRLGTHIEHLYETIDHVNQQRTTQIRIITSTAAVHVPERGGRVAQKPFKRETVEQLTRLAVRMAESREYHKCFLALDEAIKTEERARRNVPWEVYCLRGAASTYMGIDLWQKNNKVRARQWFEHGLLDLDIAAFKGRDQLLPRLLRGLAANNVGMPAIPRQPTATQERYLLETHDEMKSLLKNRTDLSALERAQCYYLLGFTHMHLSHGTPVNDFQKSYQAFPSDQARHKLIGLKHPVPAMSQLPPPLFDVFRQILDQWTNRSSAQCSSCNSK